MKRIRLFALSVPAAVLLIACTTPRPASNTVVPAQSPTAAPTQTAPPSAATAADAPGTPQVLQGPGISYRGIHFILDPALGSRLFAYEDALTLNGSTAHSIRFALSPEDYCKTWCLVVYPVAEFEKAFGFFVFPPAGYRGGAAVVFQAQHKTLAFQNGSSSGDRALEAFGQNQYGVSNDSLRYAFRGYGADKSYALFVQVPVRASGLPDAAPTMPSGGDPVQDILAYNAHAADSLNALSPADFSPDLDQLDALVASVRVGIP